jgi:hypothetical protein
MADRSSDTRRTGIALSAGLNLQEIEAAIATTHGVITQFP